MWPFSTIKNLKSYLAEAKSDLDITQKYIRDQIVNVALLKAELEVERMRLVACGVAALANTRESAAQQRVGKDHAYYSASAQDVYDAVDREMLMRKNFEDALERIEDMIKGDDGQAWKEAEKFITRHRGTKVCIKCGSDMVKIESEDKKICSNGGCGYEVAWELAPGQKYQHKNDVEPFVEDRSQPEEPRNQTRY